MKKKGVPDKKDQLVGRKLEPGPARSLSIIDAGPVIIDACNLIMTGMIFYHTRISYIGSQRCFLNFCMLSISLQELKV